MILTNMLLSGQPNSLLLSSLGRSLKVPNAGPSALALAWIINPRNSFVMLSTPLPVKLLLISTAAAAKIQLSHTHKLTIITSYY